MFDFYNFDPVYLVFMLPPLLVGIIATILLNYWTKKYLLKTNINNIIGLQLIEMMAKKNNYKFEVILLEDRLNDAYDAGTGTLYISREFAQGKSITGLGIIAHEIGHIDQHRNKYLPFIIRNKIFPIISIGTNIGYVLIILGFIISFSPLAWVGLILFSLTSLFLILTYPIELDASKRALNILKRNNILFDSELSDVNKILFAASLTYLSALLQSIAQVLYFFIKINNKED